MDSEMTHNPNVLITPNFSKFTEDLPMEQDKNENITINNHNKQESYFHVEISPDINSLPNYIKISVADEGTKFIVNKYFIYYYQDDSTFTSIKQISKIE